MKHKKSTQFFSVTLSSPGQSLFCGSSAAIIRCALTICIAVLAILSLPAFSAPGINSPTSVGAFLDNSLPAQRPGSNPGAAYTTVNYFPSLTFVEPIRIVEHPTDDSLMIVSKDGTFWAVDNVPGATQKTLFLDIQDRMQGTSAVGEGGVGGFVFHPEFGQPGSPNRGYVYVWYRWSPEPGYYSSPTIDGYQRLSRFNVPDGSSTADLNSELVLIQQFDRQQYHIGGAMYFGTDGFLYLSVGDEGNCCDRAESTQRLDGGLFSGLLRIDVDKDPVLSHPIIRQPANIGTPPAGWPNSFSQEYYIPNDNPFVDPAGGNLEEFYALGLRHAWTVDRDAQTGDIWAADVGENQFEEVDLISAGGNYEWAYREAFAPGLIPEPQTIIGTPVSPIWSYDHSQGQAVIGAGVYRGSKHPDLFGKYLVSDFLSGNFWALDRVGESGVNVESLDSVPAGFPNGINSYLLDRQGRILMAKTAGSLSPNGQIFEYVINGSPNPEPPQFLSATAAFDNIATLDVHDGCVPYELIEPFWSDGAIKSRWLCLPNDGSHDTPGEKITFSEEDEWSFPVGTVLIKHFEMLMDESDANSARRLETRFFVHGNDGYYGITYKWTPDGSDAELQTTGSEEVLNILEPGGSSRQQVWEYPGRSECLQCHMENAGSVLGPNTRQLNKDFTYPSTGINSNQLSTFNHLGMFDQAISDPEIAAFFKSTSSQDTFAATEDRARSYLDSNCGYCHRPGGVRANFDARLTTPLTQQNLMYGDLVESFGISGEAIIVPGSTSQSIAYQRAADIGVDAMPPLAKGFVDQAGVALLAEWIDEVGFVGNSPATGGPFLDAHHPSLYINESDVLINGGATGVVNIGEFRFYAEQLGNPITPIVAMRHSDNEFTVVAIGTTRYSSDYSVGENRFLFDDNGPVEIELGPNETLATGFMDSLPDGSGWGAGTVIPADSGSGEDQIWALLPSPLIETSSGFVPGADTAEVVVGEDPLLSNQGKSLQEYTTLNRSYRFGIVMALSTTGLPASDSIINGSFEDPVITDNGGAFQFYSGTQVPGWVITGDIDLVSQSIWAAADGAQSLDLNGMAAGGISQTLAGLTDGQSYELSFKYGRHRSGNGARSANVVVNGITLAALSTAVKVPAYQSGSVVFQPNGSGNATLEFISTSAATPVGLILDDIRVVAVNVSNNPPTITPVADQTNNEGDTVSLSINASDPDNDTLIYSAGGLPSNLSINNNTGLISGTTTAAGTYNVSVSVSDGNGGTANDSFVWTVNSSGNNPPTITPVADQTNNEGDTVSLSINASDPDNDTLTYSAGGLPSNLSINSNTGLISGTTTVPGTYNVSVTVSDGNGGTANDSFVWTVNPVGGSDQLTNGSFENPVIIDNNGDYQFYSGTQVPGWVITGNIDLVSQSIWAAAEGAQSLDLNGTAAGAISQTLAGLTDGQSYELSFKYGRHRSGSGARSANVVVNGVTLASLSTAVKVPAYQSGSVVFQPNGSGNATLEFISTSTGTGTGLILDDLSVIAVNVSNNPPTITPVADQTNNEGDSVSLSINASDPDNDTLTYSAGGLPSNLSINSNTGLISGTTTVPGNYTVSVTVSDGNGGTANDSFNWAVNPVGGSDQLTNGSFENPVITDNGGDYQFYSGTEVPGWVITGSIDLVSQSIWAAADGAQSLDLNGTAAGAISQTLVGLDEGQLYELSFKYGRHRSGSGARSANVVVNGVTLASLSTAVKVPAYQSGSVVFQPNGSGNATLEFISTSTGTGTGLILDDIRLFEINDDNPIGNGGFELNGPVSPGGSISSWTVNSGNVEIVAQGYTGTYALDLNGTQPGSIQQNVTDVLAATEYTLYIVWADQSARSTPPTLATAEILIDGTKIADMRTTADAPFYVDCNGFTFTTTDTDFLLEIRSTTPGSHGLLIDHIELQPGPMAEPPVSNQLVNGGFEQPLSPPDRDPHVCGFDLPGWLVTQENVDVVTLPAWGPPEGESVLDLGGHGPGGIAQTINGLSAGQTYRLSFQYARHQFWNEVETLTADVKVNGAVVLALSRNQSQAVPNWEGQSVDFVAPASGVVTIEFESTSLTVGGGIAIDDLELTELP
ncbi:MAG: DUF642 domain-containing protein [Gammaproteobacteria bacterium]|nr:DUF642 domain-containing protein [Gammaproteobacteria bacterium]